MAAGARPMLRGVVRRCNFFFFFFFFFYNPAGRMFGSRALLLVSLLG